MKEFIAEYWLNFAFSIIIGVLSLAVKHTSKKTKIIVSKYKNLQLGMLSLLRAELIRSGEKYQRQKWLEVYAKDAYDKAYIAYHELGGNGTMTELHSKVMALPTVPFDNKKE